MEYVAVLRLWASLSHTRSIVQKRCCKVTTQADGKAGQFDDPWPRQNSSVSICIQRFMLPNPYIDCCLLQGWLAFNAFLCPFVPHPESIFLQNTIFPCQRCAFAGTDYSIQFQTQFAEKKLLYFPFVGNRGRHTLCWLFTESCYISFCMGVVKCGKISPNASQDCQIYILWISWHELLMLFDIF